MQWPQTWPTPPIVDDILALKPLILARLSEPRRLYRARDWIAKPARTRPKLSDYAAAAEPIGVAPAWLRAICLIETAEQAMTPEGTPEIWIDAAWWRLLDPGRRAALACLKPLNDRDLALRAANLDELAGLNPSAAVQATAWGCARLQGAHHDLCGFQDPALFQEAMKAGAASQLRALARFISHPENELLHAAMARGDVAAVAFHWLGRMDRERALREALEFVDDVH